jgi:hypothetical protein
MSHNEKVQQIVARIRRRIERKIEDVLGEGKFGFREEKELEMQLQCCE